MRLSTRFYVRLFRILTWRHPRCVNCQDTNPDRLRRHADGLRVCAHCEPRPAAV